MNRKKFLVKSSLGISGLLLGAEYLLSSCSHDGHNMNTMTGVPVTVTEGQFTEPLPVIPEALADTKLEPGVVSVNVPGLGGVSGFGYAAGALLGPVFRIQKGENFSMSFQNKLTEATNIHWHGVKLAANMDGHPSNKIEAGSSFTFQFPVIQRAGTSWYHPHVHETTGKQVFKGLAGLFIIEDNEEAALNLPSGERELSLVLQDKRISEEAIQYNPTMAEQMVGYMGTYILVNGAFGPRKTVESAKYRVRILNGSNARIYNLALSSGEPFTVIGNDGGLLTAPVPSDSVMLSPGERIDLILDFSKKALNEELHLISKTFSGGDAQGKQEFRIIKFRVETVIEDTFAIPAALSSIELLNESASTRTRTFDISNKEMAGGHMPDGGMMMHNINGKTFSESRVDETVNSESTEIWVFDNTNGAEPHPMHIHGVFFQVLDRTGGRNKVNEYERGWKDTVLCLPGEKVRVLVRFDGYKGKFVFHCHNLEHSDTGMMLNYQLV